MKTLLNKVAVIMGGSSGIGLSAAKLFQEAGATVIIVGRDEHRLEQASTEIGGQVRTISADVSRAAEIDKVMQAVSGAHGNIEDSPEAQSAIDKYIEDSVPMGRWENAEEIAKGVLFLASDDASYITGSDLIIDGGWSNL